MDRQMQKHAPITNKTPGTPAERSTPGGRAPRLSSNVWRMRGVCLLTGCYILFVCFTMIKLSDTTTQLYEYPYLVSRESRQMKVRLYETRNALPALLATPGLTREEIKEVLEKQKAAQDSSLDIIRTRYRGDVAELIALEKSLARMREARDALIKTTTGMIDFDEINEAYERNVLPHFEELDEVLERFSESANQRGMAILERMNLLKTISILGALLVGGSIIWLIIHVGRLERERHREVVYRENLFNLLAASIDEIFFIARTGESFEYVSSNSKRILGIDAEEFRRDNNTLFDLLTPEDAAWLRATFADFSTREMVSRDVKLQKTERQFKIFVYPVYQGEELTRYITVFVDQTEAIAYQQTLSDALENARNANAAKSCFLSHMSHEIRTPMNAIIGMTTIALSKLGDRDRVEDCLGKIALSSRHLLGLINDVLDMSKIEGGKLAITHEPFNFRMAIQGVINLIQPQTVDRGQNFEVAMYGVDEEELRGDALRVNQILLNLLSNAVKFTPADGHIWLEVHQIHKKNNNVRFRFVIRDTGIGMSRDFLERLYRPFEQATASTASKFGGTGLGMAITKNLISLLGGTISVKSEEGKGTEFAVELPFGLSGRQPSRELAGLSQLKVLVVDDDRGTCEHAALLLDKMGLRVHWVLTGEEAVRRVLEAHDCGDDYNVCFVDWKMPDMDGAETARRIREKVGADTLIIITSAYDWTPIEKEAREAGVDAFIAKPFFASTLYNTLLATTRRVVVGTGPRTTPEAEPALATDKQKYDFAGKNILLVEDNEFNQEVAREFLEMTGATVECAENGKEALDMFTSSEPGAYDIILMDVQMPVMGGYEATRAIRAAAHPSAKSVPILAMTANAFNEDIAAAVEAGMNGHIAKPIDVNILYRLLEAHLFPHDQGRA